MDPKDDYMNIINELWDIPEFNMWVPQEHWSLAYIIDGLFPTDSYKFEYNMLLTLAQNHEANEFAWRVSQLTYSLYKCDDRVTDTQLQDAREWRDWQKQIHSIGELRRFGFVHEALVPEWFPALYKKYVIEAKDRRRNEILEYCQSTYSMTAEQAQAFYDELCESSEVLNEFHYYVRNGGTFKTVYPASNSGYTVQRLHTENGMMPIEAFRFMAVLCRTPIEASEKPQPLLFDPMW